MKDIQKYILDLMEAECESRDLILVTAHDYANTGTASAIRGTYTVAYFTFTFNHDEVNILFQGEKIGPVWSNGDYRAWPGVENRHSFKLRESQWVEAMLRRWRDLLNHG